MFQLSFEEMTKILFRFSNELYCLNIPDIKDYSNAKLDIYKVWVTNFNNWDVPKSQILKKRLEGISKDFFSLHCHCPDKALRYCECKNPRKLNMKERMFYEALLSSYMGRSYLGMLNKMHYWLQIHVLYEYALFQHRFYLH